jgi:hypothetical protein
MIEIFTKPVEKIRTIFTIHEMFPFCKQGIENILAD